MIEIPKGGTYNSKMGGNYEKHQEYEGTSGLNETFNNSENSSTNRIVQQRYLVDHKDNIPR